MSASPALYHSLLASIETHLLPLGIARPTRVRLALLVTGLIAAQSAVRARIARHLCALGITAAHTAASVERGVRRTLNDTALTPACYLPAVRAALPCMHAGRPLFVALDESTHTDRIHLLRAAVPYWGNAVPLAWAVWEQNTPLPEGGYWQQMDQVVAQIAAVVPATQPVCLLADRAYGVAPLLDRCTARGWQYVIRFRTGGSHRFRDAGGREGRLGEYLARRVTGPGQRWKGQGWVLKKAGWRKVAVVATWDAGYDEPLVVITNAQARWRVLRWYARRYWIEAGFRSDKSQGWQWEASGVQGVAHHAVLVLAMAWASLLALCLGVAEAREALRRCAARTPVARPQAAGESVFTQGRQALQAWLYGTRRGRLHLRLQHLGADSWAAQWLAAQSVRP